MAPAAREDGARERLTLRDGTTVRLRPIGPGDRDELAEGFERLSLESRYQRFLAAKPRLSSSELAYLTDVDHGDHEALVAIDPATGNGVAVARYVRLEQDSAIAEPAVTVADAWQGRGLGTALLGALCRRAVAGGVRTFRALLLVENQTMLDVFESLGDARVVERNGETVTLEVDLEPAGRPPAVLFAALRAAARGALVCRRALGSVDGG